MIFGVSNEEVESYNHECKIALKDIYWKTNFNFNVHIYRIPQNVI